VLLVRKEVLDLSDTLTRTGLTLRVQVVCRMSIVVSEEVFCTLKSRRD
jgi:hypothetical protein